eukprot:gene25900-biopygen11518
MKSLGTFDFVLQDEIKRIKGSGNKRTGARKQGRSQSGQPRDGKAVPFHET